MRSISLLFESGLLGFSAIKRIPAYGASVIGRFYCIRIHINLCIRVYTRTTKGYNIIKIYTIYNKIRVIEYHIIKTSDARTIFEHRGGWTYNVENRIYFLSTPPRNHEIYNHFFFFFYIFSADQGFLLFLAMVFIIFFFSENTFSTRRIHLICTPLTMFLVANFVVLVF